MKCKKRVCTLLFSYVQADMLAKVLGLRSTSNWKFSTVYELNLEKKIEILKIV